MSISKKIDFKKVSKMFLKSETYEVLNKYNCFEKIQKVLEEYRFWPGDFFDMARFFRNTKVVRLITDKKEIIVNDIKPNQVLLIDFSCKSFSDLEKKYEEYVNRFNLIDCFSMAEGYDEDSDDFVILLYKEDDGNDDDEIRKSVLSSNIILTDFFSEESIVDMAKKYNPDILVQMADEGSDSACFELAKLYYSGEHVIKNYEKAFHYTCLSAEQGNVHSMIQLAEFYLEGTGTEVNIQESKKWLELVLKNTSEKDDYENLVLAKKASSLLSNLLLRSRPLVASSKEILNYLKLENTIFNKYYDVLFSDLKNVVDQISVESLDLILNNNDINSSNSKDVMDLLTPYYEILSYLKRNPDKIDNKKLINTFEKIIHEMTMVICVISNEYFRTKNGEN